MPGAGPEAGRIPERVATVSEEVLREEVLRVVGAVLGRPVPDGSLRRESEPSWDSLKHIELLFALEEDLDVRFDEGELGALSSTDAIIESVIRHRGTS